MTSVALVHGLAASKHHWHPLLPYLKDVNVVNFEIPGHGESRSLSFDWESTVSKLHTNIPKSDRVIYVLHSFAASFLPEIIKISKKSDRIIIIEGIMHLDDAKWTKSQAFLDEFMFENWVKKFRIGGRVALKFQLIGRHSKPDIDLWSTGFADVNEDAIKIFSKKFVERLKNMEISTSLMNHHNNITFIRGEKSNLSKSCINTIKKYNIPLKIIANSGHFPMLDNPKDVFKVIQSVINNEK